MKKLLPLVLLPLIFANSCKKVDSNDLKDEVPYYQNYGVYYDKTLGTTDATAILRVRDANGTKVELSNGASVTANGQNGSTEIFDNAVYRWKYQELKDVNFLLTKNSGAKFSNSGKLSDISNVDFASSFPASASKAAGFTFTWTGDALGDGESMIIAVSTDADSSSNASKVMDSKNTSNTVTFSATDLKNVKPGTMTVELQRYKSKALTSPDGTASGSVALRYFVRKTLTFNP